MNEREKIIRLWFDMWIKKADLGIDNIFTDDVVYTESWSPKYENRKTVKHWFDEWNTRGSVLVWEIKQFFHIRCFQFFRYTLLLCHFLYQIFRHITSRSINFGKVFI
mgnify:CR=1 FL=1